jgi:hypothetical protein
MYGRTFDRVLIGLDTWFHVLGITFAALAFQKVRLERSRFEAFVLFNSKAGEVVQQKVLRCQAEFERERILGQVRSSLKQEELTSSYFAVEDSGAFSADTLSHPCLIAKKPPVSAPPVLYYERGEGDDSPDKDECGEGCDQDCLPADAVTWVLNQSLPRPLSSLVPGQQVLCYDQAGGGMRYVEVTSVKQQDSVTEWVELRLEDGTELDMTADHPVHQLDRGPTVEPYAVRAAELQAGVDTVMVLKMVPIRVEVAQLPNNTCM